MTEIYKGHDCSKRAGRPKLGLRLKEREILVQPDDVVTLSLLDVHTDCDPLCYHWDHRSGGGVLHHPEGTDVVYSAPSENKNCENDAIIDVYAGTKYLDTAYIAVSTYAIELCTGQKPWVGTIPPIAFSIITPEIYADPWKSVRTLSPIIGWYWPTAYLQASYIRNYYDCRQRLCWRRYSPTLRMWGTEAPVKQLEQRFGDQVGRFYDHRTKRMKETECCPPKILRLISEKE